MRHGGSFRLHLVVTRSDGDNGGVNDAAREYIEAITPEHRPLFDRIHRLVLEVHPDAELVISYQIPTTRSTGTASM